MESSSEDIWSNRLVLLLLYILTFLSFGLGFIIMDFLVSVLLCVPDLFTGDVTSNPIGKFTECYKGSMTSIVPLTSGFIFGCIAMYPSYKVLYEVLFGDKYIRAIL